MYTQFSLAVTQKKIYSLAVSVSIMIMNREYLFKSQLSHILCEKLQESLHHRFAVRVTVIDRGFASSKIGF